MKKRICFVIHIGKCAGNSVFDSIVKSSPNMYDQIIPIHTVKPPISNDFDYLITLRNPLKRLISAYNYSIKRQKPIDEKEAYTLRNYPSLDFVADHLYKKDGSIRWQMHAALSSIEHIKYGIKFYLDDFLYYIKPSQIQGVVCLETIHEDLKRILGASSQSIGHINKTDNQVYNKSSITYSEKSIANLKRWLEPEYNFLKRFHNSFALTNKQIKVLEIYDNK